MEYCFLDKKRFLECIYYHCNVLNVLEFLKQISVYNVCIYRKLYVYIYIIYLFIYIYKKGFITLRIDIF